MPCRRCGNEVEPGRATCTYCGGPLAAGKPVRSITIDLEAGRPTVPEALARLERELAAARVRGVRWLTIIHGYGSSGSGGAIRDAVRGRLARRRRQGRIRDFHPGERPPADGPRVRPNPGMTLVRL